MASLAFSIKASSMLIGFSCPSFPWNRATETIPTVLATSRYEENPSRKSEHGLFSLTQLIMASPILFSDSELNTDRIQLPFFPLEPCHRDDSNGPCRIALRPKPIERIRTRAIFTALVNYCLL